MPKNHRALSKQPGGFLHFLGVITSLLITLDS